MLDDGEKTSGRVVDSDFLRAAHFCRLFEAFAGPDFFPAVSCKLLEMRLHVLVHKRHRNSINVLGKTSIATGVGNVLGNKGGLVAGVQICDTRLGFISCHLAAHMGHLTKRNENLKDIFAGASASSCCQPGLDIENSFHHLFVLGDLNYRIDPSMGAGVRHLSHDEKWKEAAGFVDRFDWNSLLVYDQLSRQKSLEDHPLYTFTEAAEINFPPTFKVSRMSGTKYLRQRVPSYCDRILYRSLPGNAKKITPVGYDSAPAVSTSDHKPVCATFEIADVIEHADISIANRDIISHPKIAGVRLELHGVRLSGSLPQNASAFLEFYSDPPGLLRGASLSGETILDEGQVSVRLPPGSGVEHKRITLSTTLKRVGIESDFHIFVALREEGRAKPASVLAKPVTLGISVIPIADFCMGEIATDAAFRHPLRHKGTVPKSESGSTIMLIDNGLSAVDAAQDGSNGMGRRASTESTYSLAPQSPEKRHCFDRVFSSALEMSIGEGHAVDVVKQGQQTLQESGLRHYY